MQIIYNETKTYSLPVQLYVNKIKNRIVFKIKTGYELELLSPETGGYLLGGTKKLMLIKRKMEKMRQN